MKLSHEIMTAFSEKYDITFANSYGEPGYDLTNEDKGVLLTNWNDVPDHVTSAFERAGYDIEWSDEWFIDYEDDCKAYRTQGNSYHWKPSYAVVGCEYVGKDAILEDPEEYIETLLNNPTSINLFDEIDLEDLGFKKVNEDNFESGWHDSNDQPTEILEGLLEKHPHGEFLFTNLRNEQFRQQFDVYGKF